MENINNTGMLIELSVNELVNIEGGTKPSVDTGFWYDLAWGMAMKAKLNWVYGIPV